MPGRWMFGKECRRADSGCLLSISEREDRGVATLRLLGNDSRDLQETCYSSAIVRRAGCGGLGVVMGHQHNGGLSLTGHMCDDIVDSSASRRDACRYGEAADGLLNARMKTQGTEPIQQP